MCVCVCVTCKSESSQKLIIDHTLESFLCIAKEISYLLPKLVKYSVKIYLCASEVHVSQKFAYHGRMAK